MRVPRQKFVPAIATLAVALLISLTGCAPEAEAPEPAQPKPVAPTPEASVEDTEVTDKAEEPEKEEPAAEPTAEDVNGYWCPTPESQDPFGCMTVELPNVIYDSGETYELKYGGEQAGGFNFSLPGAPWGVYYPAGWSIDLPDGYYPGNPSHDQGRIWNGQTVTMWLRQ